MSQRRIKEKAIGATVATVGIFLMIGIGGAVESGTISAAAAFIRMAFGCGAIWCGAALYGGLE